MKLVLKILNFVIIALAAAATVCLFAVPMFSFNSRIDLDIKSFSNFVPATDFTGDADYVQLLGTDKISLGISFSLNAAGVSQIMDGNHDEVNEKIINKNIDGILSDLREPVDLITNYYIKEMLKSNTRTEITQQVDNARQKYGASSSTEEIMDEVGMNDEYFDNFASVIYAAANEDTATLDSVSEVLFEQVDDALERAQDTGCVDTSSYNEEAKTNVKNNLVGLLEDMKLLEDDGKITKISQISYAYLSSYLKQELTGKVSDDAVLERREGETIPQYSDRLVALYATTQVPDVVYEVLSYVSMGLFIGLFLFAAVWLFLLGFTLFRTFTRKPWTIFGPWFWFVGSLQIVLGYGLTYVGKFIVPGYDFSQYGIPIRGLILAPRTYALAPSIIYLILTVFAIGYGFIKRRVKKQIKEEQFEEDEEEEE